MMTKAPDISTAKTTLRLTGFGVERCWSTLAPVSEFTPGVDPVFSLAKRDVPLSCVVLPWFGQLAPFEQIEGGVDLLIQRLLPICRPAAHRHPQHAHRQCRE